MIYDGAVEFKIVFDESNIDFIPEEYRALSLGRSAKVIVLFHPEDTQEKVNER